ncbi:MAG: hypothetical protein SCALA702_00820 [Melioribacteraceae bacterium]|nr:MAG: hypothetical protein SCALA702_00820 [Melioribacteraceae bacterium]
MKKVLFAIFLVGILTNCSSSEKIEKFDYGSIENGVYSNTFFDFSIILPENWVVQSREQIDKIAEQGKDIIVGEDENLKAIVKATEINTANLLGVFQFELGSAVEYNPNIMIISENLKNMPGIKKGSDYLFQAKRLLQQSQFKYDYISDELLKETINGTDFYKMDTGINYMGMEIKQTYYSTVLKGFAINIIVSYINEEQRKVISKSLNSLVFEN